MRCLVSGFAFVFYYFIIKHCLVNNFLLLNLKNGNDVNDWVGPPTDASGHILAVHPKPDDTCNKEWICEHRWRQIYNMVRFRNVAGDAPVQHWWDNGGRQIAFSRGNKAFIAINLEPSTRLVQKLQTGLPAGTYCDLITGVLQGKARKLS